MSKAIRILIIVVVSAVMWPLLALGNFLTVKSVYQHFVDSLSRTTWLEPVFDKSTRAGLPCPVLLCGEAVFLASQQTKTQARRTTDDGHGGCIQSVLLLRH